MLNYLKKIISNQDTRQKFYQRFKGSEKILELGCGSGSNAIIVNSQFPLIEYHGIDILPDCEISNIINYKAVDLNNGSLPYPNEYFDIIIFTHVIEHLNSPQNLGREINRVLKKRGMIYVETPNWSTIFIPSFGINREQHNPFNFFDDPSHIKPWSKHGIYEFLSQNCHLNVERIGTVRNWFRIPFDFVFIFWGIFFRNRGKIITSFWNIYGWSIYGIGSKNFNK